MVKGNLCPQSRIKLKWPKKLCTIDICFIKTLKFNFLLNNYGSLNCMQIIILHQV